MASRHLIADRNFSLLSDINTDDLVNAGHQLVARLLSEYADIDNDTALTVRQTKRGVADLTRLLTEDRAEQALLCGQLGLALRRYLTDKYIAGSYLCTDTNNAVGSQDP